MSNQQIALRLALEALGGSISVSMANIALRHKAITAIKEALAQPAQRKPLPYEQIDSLWQTTDTGDFELDIREFARAIEAAHNSKEQP